MQQLPSDPPVRSSSYNELKATYKADAQKKLSERARAGAVNRASQVFVRYLLMGGNSAISSIFALLIKISFFIVPLSFVEIPNAAIAWLDLINLG